MKLANLTVVVSACLGMVACIGAPDEDVDIDEPLKTSQACVSNCSPTPVTPPPADDFPLYLDTSSEQGDYVSATSGPSPVYPNYFVIDIRDLGPVPNETAFAEPTDDVAQDPCSRTTTNGTLYAHNAAGAYWYILSSKSKTGVWVAASGSGLGYTPAHCDLTISWSIPGTVDEVKVSARSSTYWAGSYYERQITEGAYWYN